MVGNYITLKYQVVVPKIKCLGEMTCNNSELSVSLVLTLIRGVFTRWKVHRWSPILERGCIIMGYMVHFQGTQL